MSDNLDPVAQRAIETDDDRMEFTQGVRKMFIRQLTDNGVKLPDDKGEKALLLAALDGMDRTALANKKIGSTEKQGAADRQAALIIAQIANSGVNGKANPFERDVIDGECTRTDVLELDESGLEMLTLAPGETGIGIEGRNFDQFMRDTEHMSPTAQKAEDGSEKA